MTSFHRYLRLLFCLFFFTQSVWAQTPPERPPRRPPPGERPPGERPPTPPPQPPPGPPAQDIERARSQGQRDGTVDGGHEGRTAGLRDGQAEGQRDGRRDGFIRCERDEINRESDRGRRDGFIDGERQGERDGLSQGQSEGRRRGDSDGQADGTQRADRSARESASGPGRQRGIEQANQSDAAQLGRQQGIAKADIDAKAEADRSDYRRGRETVNSEKWAEAVRRNDEFSQRPRIETAFVADDFTAKTSLPFAMNSLSKSFQPLAKRSMPTPEEQRAYDQAYNSAYSAEFDRARRESYRGAYDSAHRSGAEQGCQEARRRDYREYYTRGFDEGRRDGYRRSYDSAYRTAYDSAYRPAFSAASERAYRENYDEFYRRHFETARSEAYRERYEQIYQSAYAAAYRQKYDQVYPIYADQAYQRGRADENQDFVDRPLRLISVDATETINNGLFEPGEALRTRFVVRNFANRQLAGQSVKIVVTSSDLKSVILSEPSSLLRQGLEAQSQTSVSEALEFSMTEHGLNQSHTLYFDIYVNGRLSDRRQFSVRPQYLADIKITQSAEIKEGLPTRMTVVVKNQSQTPTAPDFEVELTSQEDLVELVNAKQLVGVLVPGQERALTFTLIGRTHSERVDLPLALVARTAGRTVGLINRMQSVPVSNDYRIDIIGGLEMLPQTGVARIEYQITNVSAQRMLNGLQLVARVVDDSNGSFAVLGPNPQYLAPLILGQTTSFVVPILVKSAGQRGVLEVEVQENGVPMMIHRRGF